MISAIIMASGFGRRMGGEKLLLKVNGIPIVERVIKSVKFSKVNEVILIYRRDEIRDIGIKYGITTVYNNRAEDGQSQAVKLGISSSEINSKGYMFFVGDQPFIDSETINKIIDDFNREDCKIAIPYYNGVKGNPIIFSRELKRDLLNIKGDSGGRIIIKDYKDEVYRVNINNSIIGLDVDNYEDYKKILNGR